jgi:hypothetical protein
MNLILILLGCVRYLPLTIIHDHPNGLKTMSTLLVVSGGANVMIPPVLVMVGIGMDGFPAGLSHCSLPSPLAADCVDDR